jgi:hypothetical protein
MMPRLQCISRTKKEIYGIQRHDSYNITIPYTVATELKLKDAAILYGTASEKTRIIRLHAKASKDSVPVKIRLRLTKTYRNQKYYSAKITVPIKFIKLLSLSNESLDIFCHKDSIMIKPEKH